MLNRLLVGVVLGYSRFTENLCRAFDGCESVDVLPIGAAVKVGGSTDKKNPLDMFISRAILNIERGNHLLIITGFPHDISDAAHVAAQCPNLCVLSLEGPPDIFAHKAQSTGGLDGLSYENFIIAREQELQKQRLAANILAPGGASIIEVARSERKQRHFLKGRMHEFVRTHQLRADIRETNFAPQGMLVPAVA